MVSNIGASTQEGSLLRSNISSICAVEGKGHIIQRYLSGLISHPLGGLSHQIRISHPLG